MSPTERFVDGLEERAGDAAAGARAPLPPPGRARRRHRRARRWRRGTGAGSCRRCCATSPEVHTGTSLLGTYVDSPARPSRRRRCSAPCTPRVRSRWRAGARGGRRPDGGVEQRRQSFEDVAATGVDWWLQAYVTDGAPGARLAAAAPGRRRRAPRPSCSPWTPRWWGRSTDAGDDGVGRRRARLAAGRTSRRATATRPGAEKATDLGPQDVAWLARGTGLPVVVKGVLRPDDARRCVDAGARAVWVSNHGGRQLDRAAATAALPRGRGRRRSGRAPRCTSTAGSAPVARAHGAGPRSATGVFLGRLPLYALAADGSAGVQRMFAERREELVEAMTLAGVGSVGRVPASLSVGRPE